MLSPPVQIDVQGQLEALYQFYMLNKQLLNNSDRSQAIDINGNRHKERQKDGQAGIRKKFCSIGQQQ